MLRRSLVLCGVALIAATQGSDSWARGGRGFGHVGHVGHFGGGFAVRAGFAPRPVFFAAPIVYFRPAYFPPPPVYYYPPTYYAPPPPVYYEQPVQSYLPPTSSYAPARPAYYDPPPNVKPAQTRFYICKDSSGRTSVTNRKEHTVGKVCDEQFVAGSPPEASRYRYYCPDVRKYYPDAKTCASAWLKVVPDGVAASR